MYRPKHVEWTCREINSLHIVASVGHSIEYYDARNNKYKIHQQIFYALPLNFNISILLFFLLDFLVLKVSSKPHSTQYLISYASILSVFRLTAVLYGKYSYFVARPSIFTVQVYYDLSNYFRNIENIWSHNKRHKTISFTCLLHIPIAHMSISLRN